VSNCQHADRPLTHINKKGRPVSQCPHCRGLRKSHASHVKCVCGDKAHAKAECGLPDKGDVDPASDYGAADGQSCCCSHGGRCACAIKKEHLDPVLEVDVPGAHRAAAPKDGRKPRLATAQSDGSLTVFANGHHKPVHKFNHAAHESGAPYKIPRPHSIHGSSAVARKSTDSLPSAFASTDDRSQLLDSIYGAQPDERLVRSEHGSPGMRPTFDELNGQLPHLDLLYYPGVASGPASDAFGDPAYRTFEPFVSTPDEPSAPAGLSMPPVDWSAIHVGLDNLAYASAYSQPPSYASFEQSTVGRPGLTASSSGEMSELEISELEVDEVDDPLSRRVPSPRVAEAGYYAPPDRVCVETYRPDHGSAYARLPARSAIHTAGLEGLAFDAYLQSATASPNEFEDYDHTRIDPEAFIRHGLTVRDAQKLAHLGAPAERTGELSIPAIRENCDDNVWAGSYGEDDLPYDSPSSIPDRLWMG
jgi:hypothetical protein